MHKDKLLALSEAVRIGNRYHLFDAYTGEYLESRFFPRTAENVANDYRKRGNSVVVKYLSNVCPFQTA